MGKSRLTVGPMNSGKTAYLIVEYNNLKLNNLKVLTIKPKLDTRDYGVISSRILPNNKIEVDLLLGHDEPVPMNWILSENYDVILVDEVQMFTDHQVKQLHYLTVISDIHVYMYGLLMSCTGDPFPASMLAKAICGDFVELHTINKQKQRKEYAVKYDSNRMPVDITSTKQIEAGDSIYKAVSKEEYFTIYRAHMDMEMGITEHPSSNSDDEPEKVLAVKFEKHSTIGGKNAVLTELLDTDRQHHMTNLINVDYFERSKAEHDPSLVQLLKMTAIGRYEDGKLKLFTVKRINKSTESRLHDLNTCLFGGHVNPCDSKETLLQTLEEGRVREIREELLLDNLAVEEQIDFHKLIYTPDVTDASNVSNFHAGISTLLILEEGSNVFVKESHKLSKGEFTALEDLLGENTEAWSREFAIRVKAMSH